MFESIVIRRSPVGCAASPGELAEALLFYDNVHLLLDFSNLGPFLKKVGVDKLLSMIENGRIKATYLLDSLGTHTETENYVQKHQFVAYQLVGNQETKALKKTEDKIRFIFERALGKSTSTNKSVSKFIDLVPIKKLDSGFDHEHGIPGIATDDLRDPVYLRKSIELILKLQLPRFNLPNGWEFEALMLNDGFNILTNLNFDQINAHYKKQYHSNDNKFSPAYLVDHLLSARADLGSGPIKLVYDSALV